MSTRAINHYHEPDLDRLKGIVEEALREASGQGASAAEAGISESTGLSVTVRLGDVETIEHTRDKGLGVTVYFGQHKGAASTTDLDPAAIKDTVGAACRIARYTAEDDCAGLADAELMASEIPDLDLYHPWRITPEQAIELALETENAAREVDERITNSEGASVNHHEGDNVYGNSHGFLAGYPSSRHSISCAVIAEDGAKNDEGMQRDYWYSTSRRSEGLEPTADIGRKAAARTLRRLGARQLATDAVPVMYAADLAGGLFRHFTAAISGGNLYRKSSFLLDRQGARVFPEFVRIHEQPHLAGGLGSAPFDSEGVATQARDVVTSGVLQGYVLSSYSARKLGLQTTGNAGGVHNLTIDAGPDRLDFDAMLAHMDTGLLVTELMGMGINITTGDYSRGAAGFWIEGGEIRYPVEEVTIAGNLADMFLSIRQIGTDVDQRGNVRTGSVLIEKMTVAGG